MMRKILLKIRVGKDTQMINQLMDKQLEYSMATGKV